MEVGCQAGRVGAGVGKMGEHSFQQFKLWNPQALNMTCGLFFYSPVSLGKQPNRLLLFSYL